MWATAPPRMPIPSPTEAEYANSAVGVGLGNRPPFLAVCLTVLAWMFDAGCGRKGAAGHPI